MELNIVKSCAHRRLPLYKEGILRLRVEKREINTPKDVLQANSRWKSQRLSLDSQNAPSATAI